MNVRLVYYIVQTNGQETRTACYENSLHTAGDAKSTKGNELGNAQRVQVALEAG